MSVIGIIEAMRSDRPLSERVVWQCLENHANGSRFWPSTIEELATELHMHKATVGEAITKLEKDKIIRADRRRRCKTVYHMLRIYAPTKAQVDAGKTGTNGSELMPEKPAPTSPLNWELEPEKAAPTVELAPEKPAPIELDRPVLMPEIPAPTAGSRGELMPEKPAPSLYPPERKKESTSTSLRSVARARTKSGIPENWQPSTASLALAGSLGMAADRVETEAEKMRDWAIFTGTRGTDWDRRFNTWLREDVRRAAERRGPASIGGKPVQKSGHQQRAEILGGSFLFGSPPGASDPEGEVRPSFLRLLEGVVT